MNAVKGTVNHVQLIGWLGAEPELKFLPNGAKVCRFRVATKRPAGQDASGNRAYETDWTTIETWEALAELCTSYLHKGSRVMVQGNLRSDSWTDKESGQPRYRTFVRAEEVLFLDSRPSNGDAESVSAEETEEVPF